jgi:transcriptional regulator with XRE-family HTH domain
MNIPNLIKELLREMSQKQISTATGISQSTISKTLRGKNELGVNKAEKLISLAFQKGIIK